MKRIAVFDTDTWQLVPKVATAEMREAASTPDALAKLAGVMYERMLVGAPNPPLLPITDDEIMDAFRESCAEFRWPSSVIDGVKALLLQANTQGVTVVAPAIPGIRGPRPYTVSRRYEELSRESLENHASRLNQMLQDDSAKRFYDKHAFVKSSPSCLCCGNVPEGIAIRHAELPGIVICKKCHDAATSQPTDVATKLSVAADYANLGIDSRFVDHLQQSLHKYPQQRKMFDGLLDELSELRRAYLGDGDIANEALDVAVVAYRIATGGDLGGNEFLRLTEKIVAWENKYKRNDIVADEQLDPIWRNGYRPLVFAEVLAVGEQSFPKELTPVRCGISLEVGARDYGWLYVPHPSGTFTTATKLSELLLVAVKNWLAEHGES